MQDGQTDIPQLISRYARYQELLEEVAQAIQAREEHRLTVLEGACRQVLEDIQMLWSEWESAGQAGEPTGGSPDSSWGLLEASMNRASEQLSLNQAALAQWVGEVGSGLREAHVSRQVVGAYAYASETDPDDPAAQYY